MTYYSIDSQNETSPPQYSYGVLLFFLITVIAGVPFAEGKEYSGVVMEIALTAVLLFSVYSLSHIRHIRWWALALASVSTAENWLLRFQYSAQLHLGAYVCTLLFFILVIAVIARNVYRSKEVNANVILGAICLYFLACIAWAFGYGLMETSHPGSFSSLDQPVMLQDTFSQAQSELSSLIYFSMVTFTTLGYGDIVPVTAAARNLAALEAVMGQLYVAVLLARLMGMYLQQHSIRQS